MAGRTADAPITSRTARMRLKVRHSPYYRPVREGVALGYRRVESGPGSWILRTTVGAKYATQKIGEADDLTPENGKTVLSWDAALKAATSILDKGAVRRGGMTVGDALDGYIKAFVARSKKAGEDAEARLKKHVPAALRSKTVGALRKADIEEWHAGMVRQGGDAEDERRSRDTANRILTFLKAALNRAFGDQDNGIPSDAAWRLVRPFREAGQARKVFLDAAEMRTLIDATSGDFRNLVLAGIHTGARLGEITAAVVRDFDRRTHVLHIRHGKTGPRDVILSQAGAEFFGDVIEGRELSAPLIPRGDGFWNKSDQHRPMKAAVKKAKLDPSTTFYSLRHSYASQALLSGIPMQLLAENLGTSVRMIEAHYGKFSAQARRDLIEAAAPRI